MSPPHKKPPRPATRSTAQPRATERCRSSYGSSGARPMPTASPHNRGHWTPPTLLSGRSRKAKRCSSASSPRELSRPVAIRSSSTSMVAGATLRSLGRGPRRSTSRSGTPLCPSPTAMPIAPPSTSSPAWRTTARADGTTLHSALPSAVPTSSPYSEAMQTPTESTSRAYRRGATAPSASDSSCPTTSQLSALWLPLSRVSSSQRTCAT